MNMIDVEYNEDTLDMMYDWVQALRISEDIDYTFQETLDDCFSSPEFQYDRLDPICATVKCYGRYTAFYDEEIWALKVKNGWLVCTPIRGDLL